MKRRVIVSSLIIFAVVFLDQVTKVLALQFVHPTEVIELLPVLNLVNVKNQGAAFGMFSSLGNTFFIGISLAAISFMSWVMLAGREDSRIFALLVGGAVGNLIDRLRLGYVVDFIDVSVAGHHWPAFNIADSALTVGIGILLIQLFRKH